MIQATEAIKLLSGVGQPLTGRMLHVDTRTMQFRELRLRRDSNCPACGDNPSIAAPADIEFNCALPDKTEHAISHEEFQRLLASPPPGLCVLDVREKWEHLLSPWPAATHVIPFGELGTRLGELPRDGEIVVACTIGERSAAAVPLLREHGHASVRHLKDGLRDFLA